MSALHTSGLGAVKIAEIGNFWYKFSPKGYIPLSDFYKIWHGGGSHRTTITQNFAIVTLKMWV